MAYIVMAKVIFDSVLLLLQKRIKRVVMIEDEGMLQFEDSYEEFARPIIDGKFLDSLTTYPKDMMNDEMVELLCLYTERCIYLCACMHLLICMASCHMVHTI